MSLVCAHSPLDRAVNVPLRAQLPVVAAAIWVGGAPLTTTSAMAEMTDDRRVFTVASSQSRARWPELVDMSNPWAASAEANREQPFPPTPLSIRQPRIDVASSGCRSASVDAAHHSSRSSTGRPTAALILRAPIRRETNVLFAEQKW